MINNTLIISEWTLDDNKKAEIQNDLFSILDDVDRNIERQSRFQDFIEFRKIKQEDYPIIAELYTYPNDLFITFFHNDIYDKKEKLLKTLIDLIDNVPADDTRKLKRFFELFLQFLEKYDWIATDSLNRVMESKKEWRNWVDKIVE